MRLTTKGSAGHGASPRDDGGAVRKIIRALTAGQDLDVRRLAFVDLAFVMRIWLEENEK